jgi:hypothetical protein
MPPVEGGQFTAMFQSGRRHYRYRMMTSASKIIAMCPPGL